jgi:hypothetical protein
LSAKPNLGRVDERILVSSIRITATARRPGAPGIVAQRKSSHSRQIADNK